MTVKYVTMIIIKMYTILFSVVPMSFKECVENFEAIKAGEFCRIRIVLK